jgi:hypothetical protein
LTISSMACCFVWIQLPFSCFLIIAHNISIGFKYGELEGQSGQRKDCCVISAICVGRMHGNPILDENPRSEVKCLVRFTKELLRERIYVECSAHILIEDYQSRFELDSDSGPHHD